MTLLNWVTTFGGPLLLLGSNLLPAWSGIEIPEGRIVESKFRFDPDADGACDYDRACDVESYLGVIKVGNGYGLVLGDIPMQTTWLPFDWQEKGILLRWVYAPNDEHVENLLQQIMDIEFSAQEIRIELDANPFLFDSALVGEEALNEASRSIPIQLEAGLYQVSTLEYKPDEETCLILHKLEKT